MPRGVKSSLVIIFRADRLSLISTFRELIAQMEFTIKSSLEDDEETLRILSIINVVC